MTRQIERCVSCPPCVASRLARQSWVRTASFPRVPAAKSASPFPDDPRYMERGPFSYTDPALVEKDLRAAGFEAIELETVELSSRVIARDAAHGIVLGSPFRAEIERLDDSALERAATAVDKALRAWDGTNAPMSAHIATATR